MRYEFGDVVLVPFPFTNQAAVKQRPGVVVSSRTYNDSKPDVIVMAITSQLRYTPAFAEVWIAEWKLAGLLKPSAIKPVFATLEQTLVRQKLGVLRTTDASALSVMIRMILA